MIKKTAAPESFDLLGQATSVCHSNTYSHSFSNKKAGVPIFENWIELIHFAWEEKEMNSI